MIRSFPITACILALVIGAFSKLVAEEITWVFEGVVSEADPRLAPDLKSGWVLSGSFLLDPLSMEEDAAAKGDRSGRLTDGIVGTELTVDLYYQAHFQALQVPGPAGFDYTNDDPEEDGRDLLGWFFPMRGQLKDSGWSLRWLQVWLMDREGKLIRTSPPPIPPSGFQWKSSWFRLIFTNDDRDEAYVEGSMDFFSPESAAENADEAGRWNSIVAELGNKLNERDALISGMEKELEETQARVESLRRMVDLLVDERKNLQEENARLTREVRPDHSELEGKLADLTAEKALAEQELVDLETRNQALAETLSESELERRQLQKQLAELAVASENAFESVPAKGNSDTLLTPDGREVGTITIIEQPMVIEKPVGIPVSGRIDGTSTKMTPSQSPPRKTRFGPRKFR